MHDVFISYSSQHRALTEQLVRRIEGAAVAVTLTRKVQAVGGGAAH